MQEPMPVADLKGVSPSLVQLTHLIYGLLIITIIGIPIAWLLIAILGLWVGYRVVRGWIALSGVKPVGV